MTKKSFESASPFEQRARQPSVDRKPIREVFMFLPAANGAETEPISLRLVGGEVDMSEVPEPYRSSWLEYGERAPSGKIIYPKNGESFLRCLIAPGRNPQGPRFSKNSAVKNV